MLKDSTNPIFLIKAKQFIQWFIKTQDFPNLPDNLSFVKTGHGRINSPLMNHNKCLNGEEPNNTSWFKIRTASLFRKLVIKTDQNLKTSIGELRNIYGNSKNRGCKPSKHVKGSKYVIGLAIKNLREMGLIDESFKVTQEGQRKVEAIVQNK